MIGVGDWSQRSDLGDQQRSELADQRLVVDLLQISLEFFDGLKMKLIFIW